MPAGFKNATDGDVQVAVDGASVVGQSQVLFGVGASHANSGNDHVRQVAVARAPAAQIAADRPGRAWRGSGRAAPAARAFRNVRSGRG